METANIREHMEVVGSDGKHVGRVDHVRDTEIELAKMDLAGMGRHHLIPTTWIDWVDDKVHLNLSTEEAKDRWIAKQ
jgi:hypothetical protein